MKHLAFTGTQRGMTLAQRTRWRNVVAGMLPEVFHHGDCIGADAEAHDDVRRAGPLVHIHPCTITDKRAWCAGDLMSIPLPPLDRNRVMVDDSEALIACPGSMVEELRSGTWATIRYARKRKKPVHIIWPDGSYIPPPPAC
jgi:hypothetical protein